MNYDELDIYTATYDEVYEAVRQQYKNREHTDYRGREMTLKDWNEINKNIKSDLREMGIRFQNAFYNPNNMRVYIKQKFWTVNLHIWDMLTSQEKQEAKMIYGGLKEARKAYNEDRQCTSLQYSVVTNTDYYYQDGEYFTVPAW